MVRYPHQATVTGPDGSVVKGEWIESAATETIITGRLELNGTARLAKNSDGDSVQISATFFTPDAKIDNAKKLTCNGKSFKVIDWVINQTHSFLWLE